MITRDVNDIPHLSQAAVDAGRTPVESHTPELREAFALADGLTTEICDASHVVIASPMYNWGPPSALKAYIDRIINTRTFYLKTSTLAGIPLTFLVVSGGPYSEDAGVPKLIPQDHFRPLLRTCFESIGGSDIVFVNGDPTGPIDMGKISADDPSSGITRAKARIPAAAARIKQ